MEKQLMKLNECVVILRRCGFKLSQMILDCKIQGLRAQIKLNDFLLESLRNLYIFSHCFIKIDYVDNIIFYAHEDI